MDADDQTLADDESGSQQHDEDSGASDLEIWESPLGQSTYLFIWALASLVSFAIFFVYF
tara:strand:+ start:310 stop:486 length:177 start_codon:yes stop_codon:yes gene_type:complete